MARIVFVYPDHESIGLQYLMALAVSEGHEVDLVFYETGDRSQTEVYKITTLFETLKLATHVSEEKIPPPIPFSDIARDIQNRSPDLVAFSCVTDNYQAQLGVAKALKIIMPQVITIFGGIHATAVPQRVLARPEVDCVAIGEAEISFSDFLKRGATPNGFGLPNVPVKGIVYKKGGLEVGVFEEGELADLDTLPLPYKEPFKPYLPREYMSTQYKCIASRGCPYSCTYCINSFLKSMRGRTVLRQKSVDRLIQELNSVLEHDPNIKLIHFWDDCFTANKKWLAHFCKQYQAEIGLQFQCLAIPETATPSTISLLKDAGCCAVQIGVQSTCPHINKEVLKRRFNKDLTMNVVNNFKSAGIQVYADHILGIPTDTVEREEQSVLFYNRCRPTRVLVYWLSYYPKTEIVEFARENGYLADSEVEKIEEGLWSQWYSMYYGVGHRMQSGSYTAVAFMLNFFQCLPSWLVSFLVYSKLYRLFRIRNRAIATTLPAIIKSNGGFVGTLRNELKNLLNPLPSYYNRIDKLISRLVQIGLDPKVYIYTWKHLFDEADIEKLCALSDSINGDASGAPMLRTIETDIEDCFRRKFRSRRSTKFTDLSQKKFLGAGWGEVATDPYGHTWRWIGPKNISSVFLFCSQETDYLIRTRVHTVMNCAMSDIKMKINDKMVAGLEIIAAGENNYIQCVVPQSEVILHNGKIKVSYLSDDAIMPKHDNDAAVSPCKIGLTSIQIECRKPWSRYFERWSAPTM